MIRLRGVLGDGRPIDRQFDGESVLIGRSAEADLVLADPSLSRQHARISRQGESWLLEDLGSHNGSFVNGARVESPTPIRPGDVLTVGRATIALVDENAGPPAPATGPGIEGGTLFVSAAELLAGSRADPQELLAKREEDLARYAQRLHILNEVHQALARSVSTDELLGLILGRAFEHLKPEQGAIFLKAAAGDYRQAASRSVPGAGSEFVSSRSLLNEVAEKGMAALVLDAQTDERFKAAASLLSVGLRSLIAAPLLDSEGTLGMIVLASKVAVRQFTEDDLELLVSLASVAAMRLRNVALAEEAAERRRLRQELELARRIQVALLPDAVPAIAGYEIHGGNIPSQGVSGDYYEVFTRGSGKECVLHVIDVSGKGVAASLLTAAVEALSAAPIEDGRPPEEIYARVSKMLHSRTPPEKYATGFLAIVDPASARLSFCNAGHCPGLIVGSDGAVEWLGSTGPPLGLLPAAAYRAGERTLAPGDTLVVYTDGITEASNRAEEEYGRERMARVCAEHRSEPLKAVAKALERDLDGFVEGVPFADDRTVVMIRRTA